MAYHLHLTVIAIILIVVGLVLLYWIGKRNFNRRNLAGLQQFKDYNTALLLILLERLGNIIAVLLILAGILLYVIK